MNGISSLGFGPSEQDLFAPTVAGPTLLPTSAPAHFGLSVLEHFQNGRIADAMQLVETGQEMMAQLQIEDPGMYNEIQEWMDT